MFFGDENNFYSVIKSEGIEGTINDIIKIRHCEKS